MCMVMIFVLMLSSISVHANEQVSEENLKLTSGKIYDEYHGTLRYEGQMLNGVPHGHGKSYGWSSRDGAVLNYEGNYVNGKFEGYGKSYSNGEMIYVGSFRNHKRHGFGARYYQNTLLYR